jgi:hypothetical protein
MTRSIRDLILDFFSKHPNQEFEHGPVVDWVTEQWLLEHDTSPRDPKFNRAQHSVQADGATWELLGASNDDNEPNQAYGADE